MSKLLSSSDLRAVAICEIDSAVVYRNRTENTISLFARIVHESVLSNAVYISKLLSRLNLKTWPKKVVQCRERFVVSTRQIRNQKMRKPNRKA